MKKRIVWGVAAVALILGVGFIWRTLEGEPFHPPMAEDQVNAVLIHRASGDDRGETKTAQSPEDIATVFGALRGARLHRGTRQEAVLGGAVFSLQFHCKDGSVIEASFVQPGADGGYYRDDRTQGALGRLDLNGVWDSLGETAIEK